MFPLMFPLFPSTALISAMMWPKSKQFIVASIAKNIGRRTAETK